MLNHYSGHYNDKPVTTSISNIIYRVNYINISIIKTFNIPNIIYLPRHMLKKNTIEKKNPLLI